MDQGSTMKRSAVRNFAPTVTKFCVMWEGQALPHDTKFGNSRCEIVGRRVIFIWSLIHGSSWSGLIKVGPGQHTWLTQTGCRAAATILSIWAMEKLETPIDLRRPSSTHSSSAWLGKQETGWALWSGAPRKTYHMLWCNREHWVWPFTGRDFYITPHMTSSFIGWDLAKQ